MIKQSATLYSVFFGFLQIVDFKIYVRHLLLLSILPRPNRGNVVIDGLENQ